jgi:carbon monoxide dehydrogenase subunit G
MIRKTAIFLVAACLPAFADFSYDQTSKITGGMMAGMMKFAGAFSKQAREPMVNTVAVKGDRMVHWSAHHASVIDIDKETITEINFDKKQYSVMTFAQMKQMMDEMSQKMKSSDAQKADVQFKVSVKDTGEKKQIAGFDTHEMLLTMEMEGADKESGNKGGMNMTADMWIAPKSAGYNEIADFYKRMSKKLDWAPGGMGMMGGRPDMAKGMAEIYKEGAKLNGMPVFQVVKMGVHADGQPQNGQAAQAPPPQQDQQADKPSIGSVLGGFGGFGKKKKKQDQADSGGEAGAAPQGSGDASGSLMEMTIELSAFSAATVDSAKFEVPAGFKQVEAAAEHHRGR